MLPATKVIPKEILPVAGKPLIQYAVEEAAASGIETVILKLVSLRDSYLRPPLLDYLSHLPRPDGEDVEDKPATEQLKEENGKVKHVLRDLSGSPQFS